MKAFRLPFWLAVLLLLVPPVGAEDVESSDDAASDEQRYNPRSQAQIERMVGRIALYPDVLVALMLPASRDPVDVVLAARAVRADANRQDFEDEPWSDSVKRLARYPDALFLLDEDLEWTTELGDIFSAQPADVMDAIQSVRERARKLGYLKDSKYQVVVVEERHIRIHPCSWDYIYVPYYNWNRLYYGDYCGPNEVFISFGVIGFGGGYWRGYDCDWRGRRVWISPSVRVVHGPRHYDSRPHHRPRTVHVAPPPHRPGDDHDGRPVARPPGEGRRHSDTHLGRPGTRPHREIGSTPGQQPGRAVTTPPAPRPREENRGAPGEGNNRGPRPRERSYETVRSTPAQSTATYTTDANTNKPAENQTVTRSSTTESRRFQNVRGSATNPETNRGGDRGGDRGGGGNRGGGQGGGGGRH